jgi:hypothetical protein
MERVPLGNSPVDAKGFSPEKIRELWQELFTDFRIMTKHSPRAFTVSILE